MKNLLQIAVATFALGLCVVLGLQWMREARLRQQIEELGRTLQSRSEAALDQEAALRKSQEEIQRLDALRNELNRAIQTNVQALAVVSRKLQTLTNELATWQEQSDVYRDALSKANDSVRRQNDDIRRQNEDLKKLTAQRDDAIARYNKLAVDHNELVKKWNRQQEELARAAANPAYPPWK